MWPAASCETPLLAAPVFHYGIGAVPCPGCRFGPALQVASPRWVINPLGRWGTAGYDRLWLMSPPGIAPWATGVVRRRAGAHRVSTKGMTPGRLRYDVSRRVRRYAPSGRFPGRETYG